MKLKLILSLLIFGIGSLLIGQNNICSNAVVFGDSIYRINSQTINNDQDAWYKFNKPLQIGSVNIYNTEVRKVNKISLYSGNCGTLTLLKDTVVNSADTFRLNTKLITIANTDYYIKVNSSFCIGDICPNSTFDILLLPIQGIIAQDANGTQMVDCWPTDDCSLLICPNANPYTFYLSYVSNGVPCLFEITDSFGNVVNNQFGNAFTQFTYNFNTVGTYFINFYVSNWPLTGMSTTNSLPLTVIVPPPVAYTVSPTAICQGEQACLNFTSLPSIYNITPATLGYDFGDGTFCFTGCSNNQCHTYNTAGTFNFFTAYGFNYNHPVNGDPYSGTCETYINEPIVVNPMQVAFTHTVSCDGSTSFTSINVACVKPGATYLWNFGDGQTSTMVNPTHLYAALGNYNVTLLVTMTGGITANFSTVISVTSLACCGTNTNGTLASQQTISTNWTLPTTPNNQNYNDINYTVMPGVIITIPSGKNVSFTNCTFLMYQGSKIIISGVGTTLSFNRSHLYGCSQLWEGIEFGGFGPNQNCKLSMSRCVIADALVGINVKSSGTLASKVDLTSCLFNKNAEDIRFKNSNAPPNLNADFVCAFSVFTSRNLPYNPPFVNFPVIINNPAANYNSVLAPAPTATVLPHVSLPNGLPTPLIAISFFGQDFPNNLDLQSKFNIFDRHIQGVNIDQVSITIRKQHFYNINFVKSQNLLGTAIYNNGIPVAQNFATTNLTVGGNSIQHSNYFNNCFYGIYAQNRTSYLIRKNNFKVGAYAVRIDNNYLPTFGNTNTINCTIRENNLIDISRTGFLFNTNNGINAVVIQNNMSYSSPATKTFTSRGVEIFEFSSNNPNPKYNITNNIFNGVFDGVRAFNTNATVISNNTITLNTDPNTPFAFNAGINMTNCYSNSATQNTITGINNPRVWWQAGINTVDCPLSTISCNTINDTYTALGFQGQSQSDVFRNTINNAQVAVWAAYNCVIGNQDEPTYASSGFPGQPADNQFNNIGQWHSYFSNGSNGGLSKFYVRTLVPFDMTLNGFDNSSGAFIMPPIPVNPAFPFIDFCSGNGANRLVKQAIPIAQDILFPPSETRARFISKQKLFDNLQLENINTTNNTALDNFKNSSVLNNVGVFYSIDKNMADAITQNDITLRQAAQAANNSLVPADNMEALQKEVNGIYLNYLNNNNTFTGSDFTTLQQIAALCPFTEGSSVWQARALIAIYDSTLYQNVCVQLQAPAISGARIANTIENSTQILQADIFPNPSTGNISIFIKGEATNLDVEICNLLGETVISNSYVITNSQTVKIENLSEGVYIVKLTVDGAKKINQRLVITK